MSIARTPLPRLALILAVGALATAGCASAAQSPAATSPAASPAPITTSSPPESGQTVQATIVDRAFKPGELTVAAGTTVIWTNTGQQPHTVTATDGSFLTEGSLSTGGVYEHAFATPGTYAYICAIHTSMKGTVVVTP